MTTPIGSPLDQSLMLERACDRLRRVINDLAIQRAEHQSDAKKKGERADESYNVVIKALRKEVSFFEAKSDELWAEAEKDFDCGDERYEDLANAVIKRAIDDYETALCGVQNKEMLDEIERFAKSGARAYTRANMPQILARIRRLYPKFIQYVHEHGPEIIRETRKYAGKKREPNTFRYRCPLCGGGLRAVGSPVYGIQLIRCINCNLSEGVGYADKKG